MHLIVIKDLLLPLKTLGKGAANIKRQQIGRRQENPKGKKGKVKKMFLGHRFTGSKFTLNKTLTTCSVSQISIVQSLLRVIRTRNDFQSLMMKKLLVTSDRFGYFIDKSSLFTLCPRTPAHTILTLPQLRNCCEFLLIDKSIFESDFNFFLSSSLSFFFFLSFTFAGFHSRFAFGQRTK